MAELLNGRYELAETVGAGGMGSVRRAIDTRLGRVVAVKMLRSSQGSDAIARARMRSEANLAASVYHSGVAQVFDFDEDTSTDEALPFIVMQFVDGHALAQLLRDEGPMPPDQVMSVVVQVAEGLQAAHDVGIAHRDLKPGNIMLTPAGRTVIVDFGIARSETSEPLTSTGTLVGTSEYMSPEQAAGRSATAQSDLYALGIVAYTCLTGTSPFRRDSPVATAVAHLHDDLPALPPNVPPDVVALVQSLTAKNPQDRPTSAGEVAARAAAIGAAGAIALPPTFEMWAPDTTTAPTAETVVHRGRRNRWWVLAPLAVAALLVAFFVAQGLRSGGVEVPSVIGLSADDATARLAEAGLAVKTKAVDVAGEPAGDVVDQLPKAGSQAPDEGPVEISVVSGKLAVSADDVIGATYRKASAALEELGFVVARANVTQNAGVGEVVALDKSGRLTEGSTITLSVAVAPVVESSTSSDSGSGGDGKASEGTSKSNGKGKGKGKDKS